MSAEKWCGTHGSDGLACADYIQSQPRSIRPQESLGLPLRQRLRFLILKRPAQAVLAHHFFHTQTFRIDLVSSDRGDMGISPSPAQRSQDPCAEHVFDGRRIGTGVAQWTLAHPPGVKPTSGQKLAEEHQLAQWRDRSVRIPFDMESVMDRVDGNAGKQGGRAARNEG